MKQRVPKAVTRHPVAWMLAIAVVAFLATLMFGFDVTRSAEDTADDLAVDQFISAHHMGWADPVAVGINDYLAPTGALVILGVLVVFALVRRGPWNAAWLLATAGAGWFSVLVMKYIVERPRPLGSALVDPLVTETGRDSFPSGHTSFAVALGVCLTLLVWTSRSTRVRRWTPLVAVLALVAALVVAASRLYVGAHYPSDVLASFSATLAGCGVVGAVWVQRHVPRNSAKISERARRQEVSP